MKRQSVIYIAVPIICALVLLLSAIFFTENVTQSAEEPDEAQEQENEPQQTYEIADRENCIIAWHDSNMVEYHYTNTWPQLVEVRAELLIDGSYTVSKVILQPGEPVDSAPTLTGENYSSFQANIYSGRLVVFDADTGKLLQKIEDLQFRLYDSVNDAWDSISEMETGSHDFEAAESENRPAEVGMTVDLKYEEIRTCVYGLNTEDRTLKVYAYATINGISVLLSECQVDGGCILMEMDLNPEAATQLTAGEEYQCRVDSYYIDTGKFYDSIPGTLKVLQAS